MKSIKFFLVIVILATITLMVFISELQGFRLNVAEAEKIFDKQLAETARLISATYSMTSNEKKPLIETEYIGFQIWSKDQLDYRSENMPQTMIATLDNGYQLHNFNNHRWRTFSFFLEQKNIWVLTAQRTDLRSSLAERIVIKSLLPSLVILPLGGILIWCIVAYGVSPLKKLSEQLKRKRADDLSPLPLDKQPVELLQVVRSTNDLLSRLKASFQRERHFAADAAHELRTPISILKVHLHNLKSSLPDTNHNLQAVEAATNRMGDVIEQILMLNRTSPEVFSLKFKKVDLYQLTKNVIANEYSQFEDKNINLELTGSPCMLKADEFSIETLIQNLLRNACKYTPVKGSVYVQISKSNNQVTLQIEDSGLGVQENQYERILDRFYRIDGDRHSTEVTGSGLGLAIVKHISVLHQASIYFSKSSIKKLDKTAGLSVKVVFPDEQTFDLKDKNENK